MENNKEKWYKIQTITTNDSYDYYAMVHIPKTEECNIRGLDSGELGVKTRLGVFLSLENEMT